MGGEPEIIEVLMHQDSSVFAVDRDKLKSDRSEADEVFVSTVAVENSKQRGELSMLKDSETRGMMVIGSPSFTTLDKF